MFLLAAPAHATIRYVKPTASGNGSGSSWENASANLQAMINASAPGDQVWVAAGTYKPTSGNDRNISFSMKNGVAIYGGFTGMETALAQRNWRTNATILSGEIGTAGNTDNSYHVISNSGLNSSAVLDGFTITAGYSNPNTSFPFFNGGGMLNISSSPSLTNCTFSGNSATHGGGMFNNNSSPKLANCVFIGNTTNTAANPDGGGMYNNNSSPALVNCVFSGNTASIGGGMYNNNSSPQLTNCTLSGNSAARRGGGIYSQSGGAPVLTNCIVWGNENGEIIGNAVAVITYSIVKGGYPGAGNLNTDPLFIGGLQNDPNNIDALRLSFCSPAIDAALSSAAPTNDFSGNQRLLRPSGEMRPRTAEEVVEAHKRREQMQQEAEALEHYRREVIYHLHNQYQAGEITQQQYEAASVWNKPKPIDATGADIGAFEYSTNESNQLIVSKGSIPSFGNVDGTYILSADTYQAAQGASTQTNCPCWTRTEGTFPVSIGKIDGEWLLFKSATCPENPFSVLVVPIGNSSGCNPTSIPGVSWCPEN